MNKNTEKLSEIWNKAKDSDPSELNEKLTEWLIDIKPRGLWTMLGVRTTKGSQDHLGKIITVRYITH